MQLQENPMPSQHFRNLGQTSLRSKRRNSDPMQTFDNLPEPLRRWLGQAALPWSPASARRIWQNAHQKGLTVEETLCSLSRAEAKTLSRDGYATQIAITSHG